MAADVVLLDALFAEVLLDSSGGNDDAVPVADDPVVAVECRSNDFTCAPDGVIEIRLLSARGQSMAELRTEARRARPAV